MADKIKIVSADFQKATTELKRVEDLLNEYAAELTGKYAEMINEWQGQAGAAFNSGSQKLLDAFTTGIAGLNQLAADIEQTRQSMLELDMELAGQIGPA